VTRIWMMKKKFRGKNVKSLFYFLARKLNPVVSVPDWRRPCSRRRRRRSTSRRRPTSRHRFHEPPFRPKTFRGKFFKSQFGT
jgi:hypothetical protein